MSVEAKPGADGMIAVNELSMAPRDGHTWTTCRCQAKTLPEVVAYVKANPGKGERRVEFGRPAVARDRAAAQPGRGHRHDAVDYEGSTPRCTT